MYCRCATLHCVTGVLHQQYGEHFEISWHVDLHGWRRISGHLQVGIASKSLILRVRMHG